MGLPIKEQVATRNDVKVKWVVSDDCLWLYPLISTERTCRVDA